MYTPNSFDQVNVFRVREYLRDAYQVTHELHYDSDIYSVKGIDADTAEEFGLSAPVRYIE